MIRQLILSVAGALVLAVIASNPLTACDSCESAGVAPLPTCCAPDGCELIGGTSLCEGLACDGACTGCGCQAPCDGTACGGCTACSGCGVGCGCCKPRLFGLFAPSDHRFGSFISPMTNPIFFEDPRTLTEARFIFFHHVIPQEAGGGTVQLMALQLRAALTERLSIVAAKDGYATSSHPIVDDGWADVAVGLKYNLWADPFAQRLLSVGASYELPVGSTRLFQGNGDGEFHLYLTGGTQLGCRAHWLSAFGWRLPVDGVEESQSIYWSNHFDYRLLPRLYFLTEVNWYHWTQSGDALPFDFEGLDVINFGSQNVAGNDIVTGAIGFKFKPHDGMEIGIAWEAPLTDRRDIIDNRLTFDWIFRY